MFVALKNILVCSLSPPVALTKAPGLVLIHQTRQNAESPDTPKPKLVLLEHDRRFAIFPEFVYYDFAQPLKLPGSDSPSFSL